MVPLGQNVFNEHVQIFGHESLSPLLVDLILTLVGVANMGNAFGQVFVWVSWAYMLKHLLVICSHYSCVYFFVLSALVLTLHFLLRFLPLTLIFPPFFIYHLWLLDNEFGILKWIFLCLTLLFYFLIEANNLFGTLISPLYALAFRCSPTYLWIIIIYWYAHFPCLLTIVTIVLSFFFKFLLGNNIFIGF